MKKIMIGAVTSMLSIFILMLIYSFTESKSSAEYDIVRTWELPEVLNEISAIEWIGDNRIAAVQDEDGILFIFNLENKKIEEQIKFGEGGDYEGLSIAKGNAYVLRSDGTVFEIQGYRESSPRVTPMKSSLAGTSGVDVEGLTLDGSKTKLFLAVKKMKGDDDSKPVYALDLGKRAAIQEPVFRISLSDPVFGKGKNKFSPSEVEVHPETGDYYILDGTNPQLLIIGKDGKPKDLHQLSKKDFNQPEGITFTPGGTLYISNEAGKGPANILEVNLK